MIQALLVTICLVGFPYQGSSIILESGNVNDYEVVYPQKVQALPKGGLQNAEPKTEYEDTMQYEFQVNGEPVVLHLERNKGLFSEDYSETHYSPDGREITTSPPVQGWRTYYEWNVVGFIFVTITDLGNGTSYLEDSSYCWWEENDLWELK